jgi:hypothetical protein
MIPRRVAEKQAEQCLWYHVGAYGITLAALALSDRKSLPWVAGVWGMGVLLHAALLHAFPDTREFLLRNTASLMEDLRSEARSPGEQREHQRVSAAS